MITPTTKWPVAVLGATGAVGQMFVRLLDNHPWFELAEVAASERSTGKRYGEVTKWLDGPLPERVAGMTIQACDPATVRSPIVFSALDASAAVEIEPAFARAGRVVFSNAKNFRMAPDVPLLVPEVNAPHLNALPAQRARCGWTGCGAIITNANCAATAALLPLAALHEAFGLEQLVVVTMQAISGAGYPGVPSLDILGNVIPYIGEEEEKIERELPKMLGTWKSPAIEPAVFGVSAHANRVAVENGHTVCMTVKFQKKTAVGDALAALRAWRGHADAQGLPSTPEHPMVVTDAENRPQPKRDVWVGRGMTTVVGRVRADAVWDLRLVALSHNVVRGAAGGSVQNAELLAARGGLPPA
jgi:aspartate-semialdehyde dehydrogenase